MRVGTLEHEVAAGCAAGRRFGPQLLHHDPALLVDRGPAAPGELDGASADADRAVSLRPGARAASVARAEVHRRRGDGARAESDLQRARALAGGPP